MADQVSKFDVMQGMHNIAKLTENSNEQDQQEPATHIAKTPKAEWKQPRPIHDGWPEEVKKARDQTNKLF